MPALRARSVDGAIVGLVPILLFLWCCSWVEAFVVGHGGSWVECVALCAHRKDDDPSLLANAIRLNKVFKATHSRRDADRMIQDGRVAVNGEVSFGDMVVPFVDEISLDGNIIKDWEAMNGIVIQAASNAIKTLGEENRPSPPSLTTIYENTFEYVKYYKPTGVICTTDQRIKGNIIDALTQTSGYRPKHRVYPVGRLDKDSTGLILITSDGRLPNASLRREQKQPKVYRVRVDQPLQPNHLDELRSGVVITTVAQRDGKSKTLTARTKPCIITSLGVRDVEITLQEGRNRQIRKMMGALGYEVIRLHRVGFGEIALDGDMKPGDWRELDDKELTWIRSILD
jgi:23S rRNA pseudouridine2604 synthase